MSPTNVGYGKDYVLVKDLQTCRIARRLVIQLAPEVRSNHHLVIYRRLKTIANIKPTVPKSGCVVFERFCNWAKLEKYLNLKYPVT